MGARAPEVRTRTHLLQRALRDRARPGDPAQPRRAAGLCARADGQARSGLDGVLRDRRRGSRRCDRSRPPGQGLAAPPGRARPVVRRPAHRGGRGGRSAGHAVKISIVTPSFNGRRYLDHAARSILSQQGDFELEWVVIDGGSTDGSLDLLRSEGRDPRVRWVSEKDRGQAHAINKGLALARGDVVGWLNTDDGYTPGAQAAVAEQFARHPSSQWLTGRYEIIDAEGRVMRRSVARYKERSLRRYRYRGLLRE